MKAAFAPPSPVRWARLGPVSRLIAKTIPTQQPPLLLLSLPRSGSSWIGRLLGFAINALYLREPVTQSNKQFERAGTVFTLDNPELRQSYEQLADKAFLGWPDYGSLITIYPEQWRLRWRRPRRIVIKEVNPLACGWYISRYQPRVFYLVRHPAGVASSFFRKGWIAADGAAWEENGRFQANAIHAALQDLNSYPNKAFVRYEHVCANPVLEFQHLYEESGLIWNEYAADFIRQHTATSQQQINAWRSKVTASQLAALRRGFQSQPLPWYQSDADWEN